MAAKTWSADELGERTSWDASAELIWGSDLESDNTILLRREVG